VVQAAEVAGAQFAVHQRGALGVGVVLAPVAQHQRLAGHADLAHVALLRRLARRVADRDRVAGQRQAHAAGLAPRRRVERGTGGLPGGAAGSVRGRAGTPVPRGTGCSAASRRNSPAADQRISTAWGGSAACIAATVTVSPYA